MENLSERHFESIKKALEGVGLKVDKIQKKGKKTVITIFRDGKNEEMINSAEQVENGIVKEFI